MLIALKGALAHLVTAPSRPRYQSRTIHAAFMNADEACAQVDAARHEPAHEHVAKLTGSLAACTAGSVPVVLGPVALISLVVVAIGATTLMH